MLKVSLAVMFCAQMMFFMGAFSHANAFAIWGVMFMMVASVIVVVGTARHGS